MANGGYKGEGTPGGFWGCALAALAGVPLIGFSFLASALGDCGPDVHCNHGLIWWLFVPSILIAMFVGFGARSLINWFLNRHRHDR
jgi:hypothetical protein